LFVLAFFSFVPANRTCPILGRGRCYVHKRKHEALEGAAFELRAGHCIMGAMESEKQAEKK